jgi:hypothetical protein
MIIPPVGVAGELLAAPAGSAPMAGQESTVPPWAPPRYRVQEPFSLPFDPLRVLWGLRRGMGWILAGALAGLVLGGAFGVLKMRTRYEAVIQLIKRSAPPITQTAVNGEPYRPREFTNSTLAGAAGSPTVLDRVARKSDPPVTAGELKEAITVKEDKLTDFLTLTLSGYRSPQATVALAKLWSDEIISVTREMQSQESHEIRKGIQGQIDANQAELQSIDAQMAKFSNSGQLLGADTLADSFVHMQDDVDARYNAARLELEGFTSQLTSLQAELLRHTPEAEELRQARADLDAFRARYTDSNPLVLERMAKIAALEAQLKKQAAAPARWWRTNFISRWSTWRTKGAPPNGGSRSSANNTIYSPNRPKPFRKSSSCCKESRCCAPPRRCCWAGCRKCGSTKRTPPPITASSPRRISSASR